MKIVPLISSKMEPSVLLVMALVLNAQDLLPRNAQLAHQTSISAMGASVVKTARQLSFSQEHLVFHAMQLAKNVLVLLRLSVLPAQPIFIFVMEISVARTVSLLNSRMALDVLLVIPHAPSALVLLQTNA